jgi:hypothetical protein
MDAIIAALDHLEIGMPVTAANLTMYPLLMPEESAPGYLTLDEALAAGLASVMEVSEAGSVPELIVNNLGGMTNGTACRYPTIRHQPRHV